jgi:hypothetical protein
MQTKTYEWKAGNSTPRSIPEGTLIDRSVLQRIRDESLKYAPPSISEGFRKQVGSLQVMPQVLPYNQNPTPMTESTRININNNPSYES